jgi:hypothetical protein
MRRNASPVGSTGLPTRFTLFETVVVAVALSLAVVAGALAVSYPVTTLVVAAGVLGGQAAVGVARRVRASRQPTTPVLAVRLPFTDVQVEV